MDANGTRTAYIYIYINTIVFNVFGIACIFFDMITSITAHKSK